MNMSRYICKAASSNSFNSWSASRANFAHLLPLNLQERDKLEHGLNQKSYKTYVNWTFVTTMYKSS